MSSSEEFEIIDTQFVNPNIMRPQDSAMLRAGLHHLSCTKPLGGISAANSIVIHEIGYVEPIKPRRIYLQARIISKNWDNRPA